MSVTVVCNHCRQPVSEVTYVLLTVDAETYDLARPIGRVDLHWECVALYGRTGTAAATATIASVHPEVGS